MPQAAGRGRPLPQTRSGSIRRPSSVTARKALRAVGFLSRPRSEDHGNDALRASPPSWGLSLPSVTGAVPVVLAVLGVSCQRPAAGRPEARPGRASFRRDRRDRGLPACPPKPRRRRERGRRIERPPNRQVTSEHTRPRCRPGFASLPSMRPSGTGGSRLTPAGRRPTAMMRSAQARRAETFRIPAHAGASDPTDRSDQSDLQRPAPRARPPPCK
jgi:hypothetical protein